MSFYEHKMVLRVEIPELKGKNHAETYDYFLSKLGEPKDVEKYNGEIEWFSYGKKTGGFKEAFEMTYKTKGNDDKVGVEYVLGYKHETDLNGDGFKENIPVHKIQELTQQMVELFGVDPSTVGLFVYSWYNASDEIVEFN